MSPAKISTVNSRSEQIVIRGVKVAKPISNTRPTGSDDLDCAAISSLLRSVNVYRCVAGARAAHRDVAAPYQT